MRGIEYFFLTQWKKGAFRNAMRLERQEKQSLEWLASNMVSWFS
jgi:hypothetical protein